MNKKEVFIRAVLFAYDRPQIFAKNLLRQFETTFRGIASSQNSPLTPPEESAHDADSVVLTLNSKLVCVRVKTDGAISWHKKSPLPSQITQDVVRVPESPLKRRLDPGEPVRKTLFPKKKEINKTLLIFLLLLNPQDNSAERRKRSQVDPDVYRRVLEDNFKLREQLDAERRISSSLKNEIKYSEDLAEEKLEHYVRHSERQLHEARDSFDGALKTLRDTIREKDELLDEAQEKIHATLREHNADLKKIHNMREAALEFIHKFLGEPTAEEHEDEE